MADPDVIVIGGGAAGLGAARRLAAEGVVVRVIEARSRLGGRAWTLPPEAGGGCPLDLGCGWLHSAEENELSTVAVELGFVVDKTAPPWARRRVEIGFPRAEQEDFQAAMGRLFARLEEAGEPKTDQPADRCLEPGSRWNPLLNATSTYINGAELDRVSVHDFYNYHDTGVNWRVTEGYGALIAALGAGLDIVLDCRATLVDHGSRVVRIETSRGEMRARAVIVTVPTNLIADGALQFQPALPDKVEAAAGLPLGLADKVFLRLDDAEEFQKESRIYGAIDRTETGTYHFRPFGRPIIEGYFGGRHARALEQAGEGAFAAFAIDQIVSVLGSGMRKRLHPIAASAWAKDPLARGSYSHALPGHAPARPVLAAPVDGRLFFAGEACSIRDFSTAHGAYRTGLAAADAVMAAIAATAAPRR